jgi:hypothetical protein
MASQITPTEHERNEWLRFAYALKDNGYGFRARIYRAHSTLDKPMSCNRYDSLQRDYRNWLTFGQFPV